MVFHKPLLDVLNSKTRQKIVLFLLKHEAQMSEREIATVSGVSHMSINRTMQELAQMNIVHVLRTGRSHLWKINRESYAFQALLDIFQLPEGRLAPREDLKKTILSNLPLPRINKIVLFGSIAQGTEQSDSDIDLFVQVKNKAAKQHVEPAVEKLATFCLERYGNLLAPYILTIEEIKARSNLPLIANINKGITLYLSAGAHES